MSKKLSFREALEQRGRGPADAHIRSGSVGAHSKSVKVHLRRIDAISRPVDLARLLVSYGLSLRKAHETIERLARGDTVALELAAPDFSYSQLAELGVEARRIEMPVVDPRHVRDQFHLTQAEFADRFWLGRDNVRNWEQGRNVPDPSTRLLLKVIEDYPQVIEAILRGHTSTHIEAYKALVNGAEFQTQLMTYTFTAINNILTQMTDTATGHLNTMLQTTIESRMHAWLAPSKISTEPPEKKKQVVGTLPSHSN